MMIVQCSVRVPLPWFLYPNPTSIRRDQVGVLRRRQDSIKEGNKGFIHFQDGMLDKCPDYSVKVLTKSQ